MADFEHYLDKALEVSSQDTEIRNTLIGFLILDNDENAGYKAAALEAVEVCVAVANAFLSIRKQDSARTLRLLADLTIGLNGNQFWVRNANSLVPMIQMGIFSYIDETELLVEKVQNKNYTHFDTLISGSRAIPLEIIAYVVYLLGGPKLAIASGLSVKKSLYKHFM